VCRRLVQSTLAAANFFQEGKTMKKVLSLISVCAVLIGLCALASAQSKTAGSNFAGTWVLDKAKSELPEMMQNLNNLTWIVTQDDVQINRETRLNEGTPGAPAGGRSMGGGRPVALKLDGSETSSESPRGKSTSKVKLLDGGKILEVNTVSNFNREGNSFSMTTIEHWELAEDGKVLTVHQKRETQGGTVETKLVFNKK
jgi:hypothetical protein